MKLATLPRLLRIQFTPVMIGPVLLGAALAWHVAKAFTPGLLVLVLAGAVCLHMAANGIDDVYDYVLGTDAVSEKMFPPDAPGWKPIPRGIFSQSDAALVSFALYGASLAIGLTLSVLVGWYAIAIAAPGILLSYFYTAPPLRLDYRGLGLGELSIFFSFGPIPALGAYYVMTGQVAYLPVLVSVPAGLLTTSVLVTHDLIYFDAYLQSGKRSITVVLGRRKAATLATTLSVLAYLVLLGLIAVGMVPITGLIAFAALPFLIKTADVGRRELSPPEYGKRAQLAFLDSSVFCLLLTAGILLA